MTDTLFIIDLDRTLIDTDEFMSFVEEICDQTGIDSSLIHKAYKESREASTPAPYSPLEAIRQNGGEDKLAIFVETFIDNADPSRFVYPDAARFLDALDTHGRPCLILTYAVDEKWQELKLRGAGLDKIPCIVTLNPYKGQDIAGWLDSSGHIKVPVDSIKPAAHAIFIDDRPRVFDDMPANCQGFLIDRSDHAQTEPPKAVRHIRSFDEIIDKI